MLPAGSLSHYRILEKLGALNHPNICTVFDAGEAEGQFYIAMELVKGRPLSALISADGLPAETVARHGQQIADGLARAHEHGVTHRDLKSANVMVTPDGRAKILDFGVAVLGKELSEATRSAATLSEAVAGTLPYMARPTAAHEPARLGLLTPTGRGPSPDRGAYHGHRTSSQTLSAPAIGSQW